MARDISEWWQADNGDNWLKGVEDDEGNPIRLPAEMIAEILSTIPAARASFNRLYPKMLPEEQLRLTQIIQGLPQYVALDPREVEDNFQFVQNTPGVHTCGPRGGKGPVKTSR